MPALTIFNPAFLLLVLTLGFTQTTLSAENRQVEKQAAIIWSQGVRLAGDLFKPVAHTPEEKLPGILLIPGWGGSKANLNRNYAAQFAQAGFIVLSLDFKGWGESDGPLLAIERLKNSKNQRPGGIKTRQVREVVNPLSMSEDVRAALHYLAAEPGVMPDNLGLWGTSLGGALALANSLEDSRVKALTVQMGPVNTAYNLRQLPDAAMRAAEAQAARGERAPYPGPRAQLNPALKGFPDWVAMKRFNPLSQVEQLQAATLIIDAEKESLFEIEKNGGLLHQKIKTRLPSEYLVLPGGHYEMYKGENMSIARSAALQWFVQHLKK